jgi:hypothetical protein
LLSNARSFACYGWLTRPVSRHAKPEPQVEYSPTVGRRAVVLGGIGAVVGLGGAGLLRKLYKEATFSYDGTQYRGKEVTAITPNDKFYTVTKNVIDPKVDRRSGDSKSADGGAQTQLHARRDQGDAVGHAGDDTDVHQQRRRCWSDEQRRVERRAAARVPGTCKADAAGAKVLLHGVDNYTDTFPLEKAMNPTTLVVYEMNGEPLPRAARRSARILVPGLFGEKNVKWVTRIEVAGGDAKGFYEQQGWGPDFVIPTGSRIDDPDDKMQIALAQAANGIPLRGIAFAVIAASHGSS